MTVSCCSTVVSPGSKDTFAPAACGTANRGLPARPPSETDSTRPSAPPAWAAQVLGLLPRVGERRLPGLALGGGRVRHLEPDMVDREPVADLLGEGRHQGAGLLEPGAPDEEGVPCLVARTAASEVVTGHRQVLAGDAVGPAARDRDHLLARRLGARERVGQ